MRSTLTRLTVAAAAAVLPPRLARHHGVRR
jgi:hypothetical protein